MSTGRGTLYVVATPIGNLGDLSPRALETLRRVSAIFCEDTRVTGKLAAKFDLHAPRISCHAHNEASRAGQILARLGNGEDLALVSDAGTPGVSDPGEKIVAAVAGAGFRVVAIPGPSALAAALSVSGLPAVPLLFLGFAPARSGARQEFFKRLAAREETLIFYETPHRLAASLADMAKTLGSRLAVLCRELTKMYEETLRGTLPEIHDEIARRGKIAGESVLVVAGAPRAASPADFNVEREARRLAAAGMTRREIAREIARGTGIPSREIYRRLLP